MGVNSEKWGQKVSSVVVLTEEGKTYKDGKPLSPLDMRRVMKERLVPYKIPQEMKVVDSIPRNAMGKSKSRWAGSLVSAMLTRRSQQEATRQGNVAGR